MPIWSLRVAFLRSFGTQRAHSTMGNEAPMLMFRMLRMASVFRVFRVHRVLRVFSVFRVLML